MDIPESSKKYRILTDTLLPVEVAEKPPDGWEDVFKRTKDGIALSQKRVQKSTDPYAPPLTHVFRMYQYMHPSSIRVMIIIDEPITNNKEFSSMCGFGFSSSNRNLEELSYTTKQIHNRLLETVPNITIPKHNSFEKWFNEGIFLTSMVLTSGKTSYHKPLWVEFSINVIKYLTKNYPNIIFLLWGKEVNLLLRYIGRSIYLQSDSIYSKGFCEMNHFNIVNKILHAKGEKEIDWSL